MVAKRDSGVAIEWSVLVGSDDDVEIGYWALVDLSYDDVIDGILCEILDIYFHPFGSSDDLVGVDSLFFLLHPDLLCLLQYFSEHY